MDWGDILGGGLIIFSIVTGTEFVVIPLVLIAFVWMYASGRG